MLYLLVPWTAINLTDFYFVRRGHYAVTHLFTPTGIYGRWRRQGLLAYGLGFAISLPFVVIPDLAVPLVNPAFTQDDVTVMLVEREAVAS